MDLWIATFLSENAAGTPTKETVMRWSRNRYTHFKKTSIFTKYASIYRVPLDSSDFILNLASQLSRF